MTDTASRTLKLASWNVNGLRAVLRKDPSFTDIVAELDADILGLQETKPQEGQVELDLPGYHQVWSYAERKGYSGTGRVHRARPAFRTSRRLRARSRARRRPLRRRTRTGRRRRHRGSRVRPGVRALLVRGRVHPQRAGRARPSEHAHGLGRRLPRLPALARGRNGQAGCDLRRF
ncbi:MAG: endonuclease/exonuclease/phosphatase family protein [Collinsella sp.]